MRHLRRPQRAFLSVVLAAAAAVSPLRADPAQRLVLVLRPAADRTLVARTLARDGLRLDEVVDRDARRTVETAAPVGAWDTRAAFHALDALQRGGFLFGGGVLLARDRGSLRFYTGEVLVRFPRPVADRDAAAWGRPLGLTPLRAAGEPTRWLFEAPLDAAPLLALLVQPSGTTIELTPIVQVAPEPPGSTSPPSAGVYQRIPPVRNRLVVLLEPGPDAAYTNFLATYHGTVVVGVATNQQVVEFATEDAMMAAQNGARTVDSIAHAGPLLTLHPLAYLTDQIVVRFKDVAAEERAGLTLAMAGAQQVRALPYVENGHVYRVPVPTFKLYDLASELLGGGNALSAVPNVASFSESACHNTECGTGTNFEYLRMMNACGVRAPGSVVLGILDEGIQGNTLGAVKTRLHVTTAMDFMTMQTCQPADPENWWQTVGPCGPVFDPATPKWRAAHGNQMGLTAAADCDDADLLGLAPAAPLIDARRRGFLGRGWTDVAFADALWWLVGGDPGWCRDNSAEYPCTGTPCSATTTASCTEGALPAPLDSDHRASVVNMSFPREDFLLLVEDCHDDNVCRLVCTDPTKCGVVDGVLGRIRAPQPGDGVRDGGAVLVAAVGDQGTLLSQVCYDALGNPSSNPGDPLTDLASHESTIAVGAVDTEGSPFYVNQHCLINWPGPFLDVVAPFGAETTICSLCGPNSQPYSTGESSAAAAAVSGVATLMLGKNPELTAGQVQCILRKTANSFRTPGGMWEDLSGLNLDLCLWNGDHSDCLGYGMVDAAAAVDAADQCTNPLSAQCPCPPPMPPLALSNVHRSDLLEPYITDWKSGKHAQPEHWNALRECIDDGPCRCESRNCSLRSRMRNQLQVRIPAANFEVCAGSDCRPFEGPARTWAAGAVIEARLDLSPEFRRWAAERAGRLELRLLSEGRPVTKKWLAEVRKSAAGSRPSR